jgi:hypothetical protein
VMHYLVMAGALVFLCGTAVYIRDMVHRNTKPNLVTWVLWAVAPLVASAAALSTGARWSVLPTFIVGFGPLLVVICAITKRSAMWKPTMSSYWCGLLSVIALILWRITREPNVAVGFAILSDTLAALPTLKKAWQFPETESGTIYIAGLLNILTSFTVIQVHSFAEIGFPVYFTLLNIALIYAVYKKAFARGDLGTISPF